VFESAKYAGQPSVMPVGWGREWCIGLLVGVLPGEPEGGEIFDEFGVFGPAGRNLRASG
jgi:hypothetical protein